ncbi:MAG: hypothetical protein KAS32_01815 [Candidatus Peribacteraceae bacterium]|nr:hypothetical protein [Candidatus Peribacteraceae bacterium]
MKLMICNSCGDVVKLRREKERICQCGDSKGMYLADGHHAKVEGYATVIGLSNPSLTKALHTPNDQMTSDDIPDKEKGVLIDAWVMSSEHPRVERRWANLKHEEFIKPFQCPIRNREVTKVDCRTCPTKDQCDKEM